MALDLVALKAKLAAQKAAATPTHVKEIKNETPAVASTVVVDSTTPANTIPALVDNVPASSAPSANFSVTETLGTAKTSEIDHIDFLSKMNSVQEAIHKAHPTMPVLLMQIHKQLRADPELVTTLTEEAIGVIVSGLQIHTKTELVSVALKESKSKAKKIPLSTDMF